MKDTATIQRKEVAKLLGVAGQTVDRYRLAGYLTPLQYGKRGVYRYSKEQVLAFKESSK